MDLVAMLAASGTDLMQRAQRRLDRTMRRREMPPGREVPTIRDAHTDAGHLAERLGLFVIIVLGEGVIQLITTVSQSTWGRPLDFAALGAFAVLVGVWALSLLHGFAGVPGLQVSAVPTRYAMGLHCAITAALAALAAGFGSAVGHADGPVSTGTRWLLCGSIAAYFAVSAAGGLLTGARWTWHLGWALPGVVVPIVLGLVGNGLPTAWLIWPIAATVGRLIGYQPISARTRSRPDAGQEVVA
jgi:low temperature requirement protein LtrA